MKLTRVSAFPCIVLKSASNSYFRHAKLQANGQLNAIAPHSCAKYVWNTRQHTKDYVALQDVQTAERLGVGN